ncbi:hypothetical protein [Nocardia sp. NPDC019395]|uniref:hypothetical protein n=1 Tax=Nocardia sp. NPDC019395 TaxID=3154686 RepID=UPI0033D99F1A
MSKALSVGAMILALGMWPVATGHAEPGPVADYGNGCVIDPGNTQVTIDSLRWRCAAASTEIYASAQAGAIPAGVKNGWVTSSSAIEPVAPALWSGKTFYTGPDGGRLMNRVTGAGFEAWPADIARGRSRIDGETTWALDYAPSPTPQVYDEIREIVPGVWLGWSWWPGAGQSPVLSFVLA